MPLIEPPETREEKRIEDFVIAIDTSMSTSGVLVREFLASTYAILRSADTFTRRLNTDGKTRTEYDEHQKAARGVGYMYAFYVLAGWMAVMMAIDMLEAKLPVTNTVLYFTGFMISGLVLAWYCIMHDAYWGMNSNVGYYTKFFIAIGALNLIFGFLEIARGHMVVDGVLQNNFINFEAGILIAGIGVFLLIKNRRDKAEEGE